MASERQIEANRRNALASTGPRTDAGKAISRRNAITHGLTADQLLLDGEDPAVFEMLRDDFFDEYAPATSYEAELTHRIATLSWRLRRIDVFEAAILKWMAYRQVEVYDKEPVIAAPSGNYQIFHGAHKGLMKSKDQNAGQVRDQLRLGRMLEAEMKKNLTAKLGRHEAHLMRQLRATRAELTEYQAARLAREAAALKFDARETLPSPALISDDRAALSGLADRAERGRPWRGNSRIGIGWRLGRTSSTNKIV